VCVLSLSVCFLMVSAALMSGGPLMGVLHRSYIGEAAELKGVRDTELMKEDS